MPAGVPEPPTPCLSRPTPPEFGLETSFSSGEWTTNGPEWAKNGGPGGYTGPKGPRLVPIVPPGVQQWVGTHPDAAKGLTGPVSGDFGPFRGLRGPHRPRPAGSWPFRAVKGPLTDASGGVGGPNLACWTALRRVHLYTGAMQPYPRYRIVAHLLRFALQKKNGDPRLTLMQQNVDQTAKAAR